MKVSLWPWLALAAACTGPAGPTTPDGGQFVCSVTAPTSCTEPALRYTDVKPLFEEHCTTCHAGEVGGPWPLNDYQSVFDWKDDIRGDLTSCSMPPYDGGVPMPTEQREKILHWLRCGMPQ